jgi:hypothetical protein
VGCIELLVFGLGAEEVLKYTCITVMNVTWFEFVELLGYKETDND